MIDQAEALLALNDASQSDLKMEHADLEISKGELADLKDAMNDVELDFVDASKFRQTYTAVLDLNSSVSKNMIQLKGRIDVLRGPADAAKYVGSKGDWFDKYEELWALLDDRYANRWILASDTIRNFFGKSAQEATQSSLDKWFYEQMAT